MSPARPRIDVASEAHLCDNRSHLLVAAADLTLRRPNDAVLFFCSDRIRLEPELLTAFRSLTGVEPVVVSDRESVESFARLPRFVPDILRRNISVDGVRPVVPSRWRGSAIADRRFDVGYVYHPGFFLSKVLAGRCRRVVMRDSGYANYVTHRVSPGRAVVRLLAGRSPRRHVWGEERWIDEIQVARPDLLPAAVASKATELTLDGLMDELGSAAATSVARIFWPDGTSFEVPDGPLALLLTQPIDQLGICSFQEKEQLYGEIAERLRQGGYDIVVKHHPSDERPILRSEVEIPADFPIEAWSWLGNPPFERAVSLNSTSLLATNPRFAKTSLQLIPPTSFYASHTAEWPDLIASAFAEDDRQHPGH